MRPFLLASPIALLLLSTNMPSQTPPGACAVDDAAFTTREGGCQDQVSDLVWSAQASGSWSWDPGRNYCSSLAEGGFSDWRMPTLAELHALDQHGGGTHIVGIDPQVSNLVWSSNTRGNKAWTYDFHAHADVLVLERSVLHLYCVRPGLPAGGPGFVGPLPQLRAMRMLSDGVWTTTVRAPELALRPCLFVAGLGTGHLLSVVRTVPGVIDCGPGTLNAAGRVSLSLNLRGMGLSPAMLSGAWIGMVVLEPAGPVLYELS